MLIMTDQQRADWTAAGGFPLDTMPFLDGLMDTGVRFRRGYTTSPLCVPARVSLLTGRYPSAHRVRQNSAARHVLRGADLVDVLRDAGYALHLAGKTHFYRQAADFDTFAAPYWHDRGPAGHEGFERWLEGLDHSVGHEPTPFPLERQSPYRIVSDAISAIEQTPADRPVFTWLSFPEPHNPYQVPEPYFSLFDPDDMPERLAGPEAIERKGGTYTWLRDLIEEKRPGYDAEWRRYRANYCGMLRLIDDQLRRFFAHVGERETLVFFVADHGDYTGDYGLQRKGAGMAERLMRIPFAVTGPGVRATVNGADFVSLADLLPTICDAIGAEIPAGVQGRSLWPMLTGEPYPAEEFATGYGERGFGGLSYGAGERPPLHFPYEGRTFDELNTVTQSGTTVMLRRAEWKLLLDERGTGELYDLATDPAELDNRYDDPALAGVRAALTTDLARWMIRVRDDLPQGAYTLKRAPHNWHHTPD
ncbi:sulfatase-like hydrolase/transferase [Nonomuraea solani]|uniref:sulfatase-like hydrolase/transferase n=1 Tax=Nonomuraea solani TaxID=1144553 RepID=UPI002285FED3|nr:sulfatase-like hydrolase/transferase [Nonomuraea solani]